MRLKILGVLLVLIGFGFMQVNAQDIPEEDNLLNNYNFIDGFANEGDWYVFEDGGEDRYTFQTSPTGNGQMILWETGPDQVQLLHNAVQVEGGVEYTLRAKARVYGNPAGQANMKLRFYTGGENSEFVGEDFNNFPADSTVWFNHEITMVAPDDAGEADVLFDTFGSGEDGEAEINLDAVYLSESSNFTSTSNPEQANVPERFELEGNYPNPFNPATTIKFSLAGHSKVKLEVFDIQGQKVKTLLDESMNAGQHQVMFNASSLPSGMYFYRLQAGEYSEVMKMSLVK